MKYYGIFIPTGTDGDGENGPCYPDGCTEMVKAPNGETALKQVNEQL